ncbi:MAG: helix-turn-helix domain-containing protein [Bacteroidetes bacterium]|nr:helix-turn-helix domain-containing protein [Bacteroidota bacterium]
MKVVRESIRPDMDRSFKILLTPNLNDLFYWHFHGEFEIVYVEAENGIRHIGDHISTYQKSDLALIGPNIPHLNFDYGVKTIAETVVVQMKENFLGTTFFSLPEIATINQLFEKAKAGVVFLGETKRVAGEKLKTLSSLSNFKQLITLLEIFHSLASSNEIEVLHQKPIADGYVLKEQQRLQSIYHFVETNYHEPINVNDVAKLSNLTISAFCRYFKKATHLTFTDFLNQYRINQSKKFLLKDSNVTEACYASGFDNLSYFNKTFKKFTGENPLQFKKRHRAI